MSIALKHANRIRLLAVGFVLIAALSGCANKGENITDDTAADSSSVVLTSTADMPPIPGLTVVYPTSSVPFGSLPKTTSVPAPPGGVNFFVNPFSGERLDESHSNSLLSRPQVVTIGNNPGARPQSGLAAADLIYEIPAEGGVSRYVAVYYTVSAEKTGPVRSARPYLLDIAKEWDGVYIHSGGSPDALSLLAKDGWPYVNEFAYENYFWRDSARRAPNNLYTSSEYLERIAKAKDWGKSVEIESFHFATGEVTAEGEAARQIEIDYPPSAYNLYKYNDETDKYYRYIDDEAQVDGDTGEPLEITNVLVQYVTSKVLDEEGRLDINMYSGGKALLFSRGEVYAGTWERGDSSERTVFKLDDGSEMPLSVGKTWIQVIDQTCRVAYQ